MGPREQHAQQEVAAADLALGEAGLVYGDRGEVEAHPCGDDQQVDPGVGELVGEGELHQGRSGDQHDRRATRLFEHLSDLVSDQIYDGRFFDPTTTAAMKAIAELTKHATGEVTVGAYKGNLFFVKMTGVKSSLYNEADSSMEASDGLNPVSSQGYAEVQSVEARSLAAAGQITMYPTAYQGEGGASSSPSKKRKA